MMNNFNMQSYINFNIFLIYCMSYVDKKKIKGKVAPTNCLWISGLTDRTLIKTVETEFRNCILEYQRTIKSKIFDSERFEIDWVTFIMHHIILNTIILHNK